MLVCIDGGVSSVTNLRPEAVTPAHHPGLVGRREQRDVVASFLEAARTCPVALVIEGEPGIGKSTIWQHAIGVARGEGRRLLACRAVETEMALPFVSLTDLLDPLLDATADPGSARRPVLETALGPSGPAASIDRLVVSRAVLGLIRSVAADGPLLIAIDDVQWLDPATAKVLGFVARRTPDLPVGYLLTRRCAPGEPPPLGLEGTPERRLTTLRVGPLTAADLDALLRLELGLHLPRPRLLELERVAGGNPLFALEVARAVTRGEGPSEGGLSIPQRLSTLLRARLDALTPAAEDAILLAAAASHPSLDLIECVAGGSAGLREAMREKVLERDGHRLRFTHPLLASVAYDAAFPQQRRDAHLRLAAAVEEPEERARHLALGTVATSESTAREIDRAAALATARGAPEAAALLAEHAARLTPPEEEVERCRRLREAADHHIAAGDPARGRAILEGLVARSGPGPERADLLWRLADTIGDDLERSIGLCEEALVEADGSAAIEARIHTALGVFTWLAGDLGRAAEHCRASAACADRAGDQLQVAVSLGELCHAETVLGRRYREDDMRRALDLEHHLTGFPTNLRPSFQLGVIRMYTDDPDGARPLLQAELERVQAAGDEAARFGVLFRLAELDLRTGDWAGAVHHADEAVASALPAGIEQEQSVVLMVHALISAHLGDLEVAQDEATRALAIAEAGGDRIVAIRCRGVLGFIEVSRGRPAAALVHLDPAGRELRSLGVGELSISGVVQNQIEALVALGRLEDAEAIIEDVAERGRATSRAWHAAVAARGRALVAAARGDGIVAREAIDEALVAHEHLPQPFELGRTLLAQGQIERRFRQRGPARRALTRALDLFDGLGAPYWAEKAADELARIPGRSPGTQGLTETERRVAELVAEGLSNKEVAGRLFISVRTVEANLSKVFRKLEVGSRTELVARVGRATRA